MIGHNATSEAVALVFAVALGFVAGWVWGVILWPFVGLGWWIVVLPPAGALLCVWRS